MTYADAINAGLKTELMTPAPDTDTAVAKMTGTYRMGAKYDGKGKFRGYEIEVVQDYLTAVSISGTFDSTEEFLKFADDLYKTLYSSGGTLQLVDDCVGYVPKCTAKLAQSYGLIYDIRNGGTTIEGRFEISEGVITIYQKPFFLKIDNHEGAFTTAEELKKFCEDCWKDLKSYDQVRRMWVRKNSRYIRRKKRIF